MLKQFNFWVSSEDFKFDRHYNSRLRSLLQHICKEIVSLHTRALNNICVAFMAWKHFFLSYVLLCECTCFFILAELKTILYCLRAVRGLYRLAYPLTIYKRLHFLFPSHHHFTFHFTISISSSRSQVCDDQLLIFPSDFSISQRSRIRNTIQFCCEDGWP